MITGDVQRIASDAGDLLEMVRPARGSYGSCKTKLNRLQVKVDQLRQHIWQAQRSSGSGVIEMQRKQADSPAEPSLVDRVLAIFDRRCG